MKYRVYFAQADSGLVKIGYCKDLQYRVYGLKHEARSPVRVLGTIEGFETSKAARDTERALHKQFAEHRVKGEWFKAAPEILAFIAEQSPTQKAS